MDLLTGQFSSAYCHIIPLIVLLLFKKIGSGTQSDTKFGRRGGVIYTDAREKGSGTPFRFASF
jgi:hypothetical protein